MEGGVWRRARSTAHRDGSIRKMKVGFCEGERLTEVGIGNAEWGKLKLRAWCIGQSVKEKSKAVALERQLIVQS